MTEDERRDNSGGVLPPPNAEQRRAAFVASLAAAVAEGERDGFATAEDVAAEMRAVIAVARPLRPPVPRPAGGAG